MKQIVLSIDIGRGNYAICATEFTPTSFVQILRLETWCIGNTKATPASGLIDRLLVKFQEWDFLESNNPAPHVVLIEQQMRGAHINLALAFASYTYFKTRLPQTTTVKFVPPSNKFKSYTKYVKLQDPLLVDEIVPVDYTKRKRFAVKLAQAILKETHQPLLQTFCLNPDQKKLDDLADAFLQSFCM